MRAMIWIVLPLKYKILLNTKSHIVTQNAIYVGFVHLYEPVKSHQLIIFQFSVLHDAGLMVQFDFNLVAF